jgi:hypothetical protein
MFCGFPSPGNDAKIGEDEAHSSSSSIAAGVLGDYSECDDVVALRSATSPCGSLPSVFWELWLPRNQLDH